jgi:type IV pilus assembly protein PilE
MMNQQRGMSLIELMIVVAIIAILGMVAYPSYMDSIRETRKSDGISIINKVMQAQQRFFVNNLTYTNDLTDLGFAAANNVSSEEGYYLVSAAACAGGIDECVNITTDAQGSQDTGTPADDDLALNSQGAKSGKWPND